MGYRRDLWEIAASNHGIVTVVAADDAGVPAVELRKLAARGALHGYGQGVYMHSDVPQTRFTQPAAAVALAGAEAFLQRESVLDLLELGQFNPRRVLVGTPRRVRRALPAWMQLEFQPGVREDDLTQYEGIPATTVRRALDELRLRMPVDRWDALVEQALHRDLLSSREDFLQQQV